MKAFVLAAGLLLAAMGQSFAATCTSTTDWTSLGPPGTQVFSKAFADTGSFTDCYKFSLSGPAESFGFTLEIDPLSILNIDIVAVLLSGGNLSQEVTDDTPNNFSFGDLLAGDYELAVVGTVTADSGQGVSVAYLGSVTTTIDRTPATPATPVPEPASLAVFGMALAGLALVRRRRA